MASEGQGEDILPLLKVAEALHIKRRTLYGWLRDANIEPRQADGKNKGITQAQFNQLAFLHGRIPPATISAADWVALLERVSVLERKIAALIQDRDQGQPC